jgi:hypothetical protein
MFFTPQSTRVKRVNAPLILSVALGLLASSTNATADDFAQLLNPFMEAHCFKCHGEEKQKGDIRLDNLSMDFTHAKNAISWQDVSDMLVVGDMPPEDEPRPNPEAISQVIKAIDTKLRAAIAEQGNGGRVGIRRLSHTALDNTVVDLLGIDLRLSENLPADPELDGFESLAITLDANPAMVLKLQNNAQLIARHAIASGPDVRINRTYTVGTIGHGNNVEERDEFIITSSSRDRKHVMWPVDFVAPQDGLYRIRLEGLARDLRTELENQEIKYTYLNDGYEKSMKTKDRRSPDQPGLVSIIAIKASEARHMDAASVPGRRVGYFYFRDQLESKAVEVRLSAGENIMIHYASAAVLNASPIAKVGGVERLVADQLEVKTIEVVGPAMATWPTPAYRQLLGVADATGPEVDDRISDFLLRAFRRPVPEPTVQNFVQLYHLGLGQGLSAEESMRNVVEGALCSPRFLFNYDQNKGQDVWALASRLSYFLWNSMPDRELLALAQSGELMRTEVLREQTLRMLADDKAQRFVADFTGQWLGLNHIELMKPDPKLYKHYDPLLESLMREESENFFEIVLDENLPVRTFLDSEFVVINDRLATHYQIDGVTGGEFRKVALTANSRRGGLLGQASVLKLTSNGTRTSPVVRGVWVLETILGDPPSPPPADVQPIEPDVRGSTTIPEMLARHRNVESCRDCHQGIDGWGLALEHFDAIGVYRGEYRNGQPIDAHGSVSGNAFTGAAELKKVLVSRTDQFARTLSEKLFTHALGHPLSFGEKIVAADLAMANLHEESGFKDLIIAICTSPLFRGEITPSQLATN